MSGARTRRDFLKATGATVIVAGGFDATAGHAEAVPWSTGTEPPKLKAPPNACDCHMHIYDSRFPVAPHRHAASGQRDRRRLSPASKAARHDAQRRRQPLDLRNRQFLHARRDGQDRRDRAGRSGGRHERHRRRTQAAARPRDSRHPLQPRAIRRNHDRHARAVVEARQRSRLARPDPYAGRRHRRERGPICSGCRARSCSTIWRTFLNRPASIIRLSRWC